MLKTCRLCSKTLLTRSISSSSRRIPSSTFPSFFPSSITSPTPFSLLSKVNHLRSITLYANPPKEEPEEPLATEAMIDLTESAMAQIARAQAKSSNPQLALRVSVESGGCHGYQYKMEVTDKIEDDDYLFTPADSPARLLIDSSSLGLISGSTIDYATELIGSSFRVTGNPHASDKGGCGCGVSWELKEDA